MPTHYEWDIEEYDSEAGDLEGDIYEHHHQEGLGSFSTDDLRDALARKGKRLVLVRDQRSKNDELDRLWAYVTESGELPTHFSDSLNQVTDVKVPKIFAKEFQAMLEEVRLRTEGFH